VKGSTTKKYQLVSSTSVTMKSGQKIISASKKLCGFLIFALSAAGIGLYNNRALLAAKQMADILIVILILCLIQLILCLAQVYLAKRSGASNYDIEQQEGEGGKVGKENKAFEKTEAEGNQTGPAGKWTKNYVPFKGFPKGSSKSEDTKENGVEVVNEVGGGDSSEKKDSSEKSDEKWKKNYVPYQEPEEDSNKQ